MAAPTFNADWMSASCDSFNPAMQSKTKSKAPSGAAWQSMGLHSDLIRALNLRGFKTPTPVQRAAIPCALSSPPRDVVAMARTGSGKTLAYIVPLLNRLHSTPYEGASIRAVILCPNRELAVQVLKTGKDLSRSLAKGGAGGQPLRWAVVIGGESLDAQFESMASRPDIVIATPGRFLHLAVEMDLDLRSIDTIIYDEADRLFEMGFEVQLREILHRLPSSRHSLLFSATLPTSLAEFAKAGLNNPNFIRLDSEHRVSPDLKLAFFSTQPDEKDAALLVLLRDVLAIPLAQAVAGSPSTTQAIIFAATKHHVEYLSVLLGAAGYRTSYIYGSLDQTARQQQLRLFRQKQTDLLVVTDVAARGLDIPTMGHVVNYDFPAGVRIFVHRVGRTARAGQEGHAWTLVTRDDYPYLLDLEAFLEQPVVSNEQLFGGFPRDRLESSVELIKQSIYVAEPQLSSLREVMRRGQAMFERSRSKANRESYKSLKTWKHQQTKVHPIFNDPLDQIVDDAQRQRLLASIDSYNPQETIFEIGLRGQNAMSALMKSRRKTLTERNHAPTKQPTEMDVAQQPTTQAKRSYRDQTFFLEHENVETNRNKGYSLQSGASFAEQARSAILDLNADEGDAQRAQKASQMKWDRKKKRFVKGGGVGEDNKKMIRGESGALLPATFKSGRFEQWKNKGHRSTKTTPTTSQSQTLQTADSILKKRRLQEKRRDKNARPSHRRTK